MKLIATIVLCLASVVCAEEKKKYTMKELHELNAEATAVALKESGFKNMRQYNLAYNPTLDQQLDKAYMDWHRKFYDPTPYHYGAWWGVKQSKYHN